MEKNLLTNLFVVTLVATAMLFVGGCGKKADGNSTKAKPAVEDLEKSIEHLFDFIARSKCKFIRNGKEYDLDDALKHIRKKYNHFKDEIKTPEDFIRLSATKSMMSGKPYKIENQDGTVVLCADWLTEELKRYRTEKKAR